MNASEPAAGAALMQALPPRMALRRRDWVALPALAALGWHGVTAASNASGTTSASGASNASGTTGAASTTVVFTQVETERGGFVLAVDTAVAPVTVANYLRLVDDRHLDGGSVYRIVTLANQPASTRHKIEVVQWGMHLPDETPAPFPPIAHETTAQTGLRHRDGTVSMARNAPGSAAAEFFICIGDQPELDHGGGRNPDGQGFAAFGQVVHGMDVVRALFASGQAQQFLPVPLAVRSVRRVTPGSAGSSPMPMPLFTSDTQRNGNA